MKNKILQLFLLLGLTVGITGLAQAQSGSVYQANIPFDFSVSGKSFKAGEYSISFGILRDSPASFLISSADGKESAIVRDAFSKEVLKPSRNARIVFDKDGDDYTLAEIKSSRINIELSNLRRKQKSAKVTGVEVSLLRK
jgi:hypothetical protein